MKQQLLRCVEARAPSATLLRRAVPLPRFAVADLISCDDLALAAMHERRFRQFAGPAAHEPRRPAPRDGGAATAAPGEMGPVTLRTCP